MIAVGFVMFIVFILMAVVNNSLKADCGWNAPSWYALVGVFMFFGGVLSMVVGLAMIMWRALP